MYCHWVQKSCWLTYEISKSDRECCEIKAKLKMHFVCISSTGFWESKLFFDFLFAPFFACFCCYSVAQLSPPLWDPMDCSKLDWLCPQIIAIVYCLNPFLFGKGIMSFFFFNYFQCLAYSSCSINIQTKSFICSNRDYEKAILQTILVEIKIIIPYLESFFWEHVNPLGLGGEKMEEFSGLAFLERQPTFFSPDP